MSGTIHVGDCLGVLRAMPDESVHCVVTSPPYFALRDYGVDGQIGLEDTPDAWCARLVDVFREVRRVLRRDGTAWVNVGSSYSCGGAMANVTDILNRRLKEFSVFFFDALPVAVPGHGVDIPAHNKRAPDCELTGLLAAQADLIKDRHESFGKVLNLFAGPAHRAAGAPVGLVFPHPPNSQTIANGLKHANIVVSKLNTQSKAEFCVMGAPSAWSAEHDERALTVDESDEPCAEKLIIWHPTWDTFALNATCKGVPYVDLVNQAVALADRTNALAGLVTDFRIAEAGKEKLVLRSVCGSVVFEVSDVRHLWFASADGVIPYCRLYDDASRKAKKYAAKQEIRQPSLLCDALQEDGWICRSTIIWHKTAPMPESVTDRPTNSHEHLFLLSRAPRYFYDADAVREKTGRESSIEAYKQADGHEAPHGDFKRGVNAGFGSKRDCLTHPSGRNLRDVWSIGPQPFSKAHFATYPPKLVEPCIRAGTSAHGVCSECDAPWVRVVETGDADIEHQRACGGDADGEYHGAATKDYAAAGAEDPSAVKARILAGMRERRTTGWKPSCGCSGTSVPATVLDPFAGAGTTLMVANRLGRDGIGIELNADYAEMAARRIRDDCPLFSSVEVIRHGAGPQTSAGG